MRLLFFIFQISLSISIVAQEFQLKQKFVPNDWNHRDEFGGAVAIDGDYAVVGAKYHDFGANGGDEFANTGAAYVFKKQNDGTWKEIQKLFGDFRSSRNSNTWFGYSVDISGDYIIVGAVYDNTDQSGQNSLYQSGGAYVYERTSEETYGLKTKITASDRKRDGQFGYSVSIDSSGVAMVGGAKNATNSIRNGAVFFYKRSSAGNWVFDKKMDSRHGYSADMTDKFAVSGHNSGSQIYTFKKDGSGNWIDGQTLLPPNSSANDLVGYSVAITNDWLFIAAPEEDEDENNMNTILNAGAVYIYKLDQNELFQFNQKIVSPNRINSRGFGYSLEINGNTAVVGLPFDETNEKFVDTVLNGGSIMIFELDTTDNTWKFKSKHVMPDRMISDMFGYDVAVSGNKVISGSIGSKWSRIGSGSAKIDAGSVYLYKDCSNIEKSATILQNGKKLVGTEGFDAYRWWDCNNKELIDGEEDNEYTPSKSGSYALIAIKEGCADTTLCKQFSPLGVIFNSPSNKVLVYPNPSSGFFSFKFEGNLASQITIIDISGQQLFDEPILDSKNTAYFIAKPGVYFVTVKFSDGINQKRKLVITGH